MLIFHAMRSYNASSATFFFKRVTDLTLVETYLPLSVIKAHQRMIII